VKCGSAQPNSEAEQCRTFADPFGKLEWRWEAGLTDFQEARPFPNTPLEYQINTIGFTMPYIFVWYTFDIADIHSFFNKLGQS
jgi:hypothetical protein